MGQTREKMPVTITIPLVRNFEEAVMERIVKYLSRKVRKPNRSHFCCFMLFLLAGRFCETA
jgi:hypothetical protein